MIPRHSAYAMVPMSEALAVVEREATVALAAASTNEIVPLQQCLGRVLHEDVRAAEAFPPFKASVVDGYAVCSAGGGGGGLSSYTVLDGMCTAGASDGGEVCVRRGSAAYVTTGAMLPRGADAVVKVEWTQLDGAGRMRICRPVVPGQCVREVGADFAAGQLLLRKGTVLSAADIGVLANARVRRVAVFRRVRVGVASTGDELEAVEAEGQQQRIGSITDANRPMLLSALVQYFGKAVDVIDLGIVRDEPDAVHALFVRLHVDVVITSGGVSMGTRDLIKPWLAENATIHFGRLRMKPGKPTTFATRTCNNGSQLVFALPGNPVSSLVTFHLLVVPAIRRLSGQNDVQPAFVMARTDCEIRADPERPEYHRATVYWSEKCNSLEARSTGSQCSSRLLSMQSANALMCVPQQSGSITAGAYVKCLMLGAIAVQPPARATATIADTREEYTHSAHHQHHAKDALQVVSVALLVCSDRAFRGVYPDKCCDAAKCVLQEYDSATFSIDFERIVPDERERIEEALIMWTDSRNAPDVILTMGGTGFSPRDCTPEATAAVVERRADALATTMLLASVPSVPTAMLSRAIAGIRKRTLIVNLVGKPGGVAENLNAIMYALPHAVAQLK